MVLLEKGDFLSNYQNKTFYCKHSELCYQINCKNTDITERNNDVTCIISCGYKEQYF